MQEKKERKKNLVIFFFRCTTLKVSVPGKWKGLTLQDRPGRRSLGGEAGTSRGARTTGTFSWSSVASQASATASGFVLQEVNFLSSDFYFIAFSHGSCPAQICKVCGKISLILSVSSNVWESVEVLHLCRTSACFFAYPCCCVKIKRRRELGQPENKMKKSWD